MKLSLAVIVASALLLSSAQSVSANSPSPRPTPQPNEGPALSDHKSAEQVAPIGTPNFSQPKHQADAPKNEQQDGHDTATVIIAVFTVVMGLATVAIAVFNWQLVGVTNEMKKATADAAKAAEAALHIDRPFLLVTSITGEISHADMAENNPAIRRFRHNLYFAVALKNYGVSPADIVEYTADVCLLDPPKPPNFRDPPPAYGQPSQLNDSIIGPHEPVPDRIKFSDSFDDAEYQSALDDKQRFAVYGRIRYRGASDKTYDTFFYWWCFVIDPNQVDLYRCNTKQWNNHT